VSDLTGAIAGAFVKLTPAEQRLVAAAYRLLATGRPAEPAAVAGAAGWAPADVDARLATWPMVYLDDRGALVGLMGLSSQKVSEHRVEIRGLGASWAWCALDPLFIVPVLGATARVTSKSPLTGDAVEFTLSRDGLRELTPASAVVSSLMPDCQFDENVIASFCHLVHYFATPAAANRWTANHPGTFTITAADAAQVGRRLAEAAFQTCLSAATQRG
jgi:alkylmercury lyase